MTNLKNKSLVSINDLTKKEILDIINTAKRFKDGLIKSSLTNKVIASCFFEHSTRTRMSFEAAIAKLGGKTIGFADSSSTSLAGKGESLIDTLKIISEYANLLILRHPLDGTARLASDICNIPIINAGDGANQHPTQTLLDLFSIEDSQGSLEGISLGIMGDLKYSRTVHSLITAAQLFSMKLFFISPPSLRLDEESLFKLKCSGIKYSFHQAPEQVIDQLDCLYMTRLQKERFNRETHDEYKISLSLLNNAKDNLKILHPLPRMEELPPEIDNSKFAYYFTQAKNGLYVRQALLDMILGEN